MKKWCDCRRRIGCRCCCAAWRGWVRRKPAVASAGQRLPSGDALNAAANRLHARLTRRGADSAGGAGGRGSVGATTRASVSAGLVTTFPVAGHADASGTEEDDLNSAGVPGRADAGSGRGGPRVLIRLATVAPPPEDKKIPPATAGPQPKKEVRPGLDHFGDPLRAAWPASARFVSVIAAASMRPSCRLTARPW